MDVPALWKDTNIFYNVLCFLITENEKLFDRNDAKLYWRTVLHIFSIIHHKYISLFALSLNLATSREFELKKLYESRFGLLTGWNFGFQTIFLLLALTHDILEWMNKQDSPRAKRIAYWRDVIYNALVVPFTLFVAIMFWTIFAIDRELVFPEIFDTVVPWWFNHCVHTNICIIIGLETLLTARRQPTDRAMELKLNSGISFGYAVVYYSIYFITNRWLYNVFGIMTWWQVCFFQILVWTSTYFFYFIHFPINRFFHREDQSVADQSQSEDKSMSNGSSIMDVSSNQKNTTEPDSFTAEHWNLKYRSLRDKFENSRL